MSAGRSQRFRSGLSALAIALLAAPVAAGGSAATIAPDEYFLSATNPLATADQRDLEALAMKIDATPELQRAREIARSRWLTLAGKDAGPEARAMLDKMVDEFVFHYTLKAINADANYPRVVRVNMLPHDWFGRSVPGSRQTGGDNPDNTYAVIPVDYGGRFEITGRQLKPVPADITYTLMGNLTPTMTLTTLSGRELKTDADGRFTITLDPDPANGRPNHIQTQPESKVIFIRETRSDWRQVPSAIRVRRVSPPTMPPLSYDQLVARAARYAIDDVPQMYWWVAVMLGLPTNEMTQPKPIAALGGLVSQQISFGHLKLADDEALVVTVGPGSAAYHNIVLHSFWYDTLAYDQHTSSFTNAQAQPNADGSTTYVVSVKDPGVYNWLDPVGLHEVQVCNRWQGLSSAPDAKQPTMTSRLVKLRDLDAVLPPGMKRVTPDGRAAQLRERLASYQLRFAER